jgi:putative hydrolase of the HAD superfamily
MEVVAPKEFAKHGKTIYDYFDKCYLSYEMKMAKPDVEIFEAVLQDAYLKPEECLFLDDGIKNIETASRLGIQTYLVDCNESLDFLLSI